MERGTESEEEEDEEEEEEEEEEGAGRRVVMYCFQSWLRGRKSSYLRGRRILGVVLVGWCIGAVVYWCCKICFMAIDILSLFFRDIKIANLFLHFC